MPEPVHFMTLSALSKAIAKKDLSPVELAKALIARVRQYDGITNSFIEITEELASPRPRRPRTR